MMMRSYHAGNILFLILLAIVLLAALAYAVTNALRGSGNSGKEESAQSQASMVLGYMSQTEAAIQRMMLVDNVKDYEIDFYTPTKIIRSATSNNNCTRAACKIFDPAGGNVPNFRNEIETARHTHDGFLYNDIYFAAMPDIGTSAPDIVFVLSGIKPSVCAAINKNIGLGTTPLFTFGFSNVMAYQPTTFPAGTIEDSGRVATITGTLPSSTVAGRQYFCACPYPTLDRCEHPENEATNVGWGPRFYYIMLAR